MTGARYALVTGADRAFGDEIVARLRADGFIVVEDIDAIPGDGGLSAVVVNLIAAPAPIAFRDLADDDWRALLDDQLYPFVATVQAVVPRLAAGGTIVQIVPKAYLGGWGGVQIAASAAACVAMARSMALELAGAGIRVNTVATGRPGEAWDTPAARTAIAASVAWLASDASDQVTGETVLTDRGASLTMAQAARR